MFQRLIEICRLATARHRSHTDYRALQSYIAKHTVIELARQGVNLSTCDVLELGAGVGGYSKVLNEKARSFIASDLTFNDFFPENKISLVCFNAMNVFPFVRSSFDLIYCSSLIEHVPTPEFLFKECHRVLRPGGTLYLSFPPFYSLFMIGAHGFQPFHYFGERIAIKLYNLRKRKQVSSYAAAWDQYGLYPLTIDGIQRMLERNGFMLSRKYTRLSPINTSVFPSVFKDLFTWHVCYIAKPMK